MGPGNRDTSPPSPRCPLGPRSIKKGPDKVRRFSLCLIQPIISNERCTLRASKAAFYDCPGACCISSRKSDNAPEGARAQPRQARFTRLGRGPAAPHGADWRLPCMRLGLGSKVPHGADRRARAASFGGASSTWNDAALGPACNGWASLLRPDVVPRAHPCAIRPRFCNHKRFRTDSGAFCAICPRFCSSKAPNSDPLQTAAMTILSFRRSRNHRYLVGPQRACGCYRTEAELRTQLQNRGRFAQNYRTEAELRTHGALDYRTGTESHARNPIVRPSRPRLRARRRLSASSTACRRKAVPETPRSLPGKRPKWSARFG